jgi:protein TonB
MSYLERTRDPGRRTTAVAGVIAVHALIGYVLVTGLVETIVPRDERPLIGLFDPAPPPPPPPSPTPEPSPAARQAQRAPLPAIPLTPMPNPTVAPFDPHTPIDIPVRVPIEVPAPTPVPSASFAPKAAAPANDPGQWIRTEDYPARDIREENEGTAFFRLVIGSNGKVTA